MAEAWRLFLQGGIVMWPLMLALIIAIMILIERISYYKQIKKEIVSVHTTLKECHSWEDFLTKLQHLPTYHISYDLVSVLGKAINRNVLQSRMEDTLASVNTRMNRGLDWLSTIVTMAPLLGLLGTVTGMIGAFRVFGTDAGTPTAITGGVGEALVATATGLCVAIIALAVHSYFSHKARILLTVLEDAFGRSLDLFDRGN
ncbi:MotA/TolQ/ExbB proton channel family protein [Veillonella montpellierensis]|uniref:MotA/TolQ/ExbB proton channel family protein n=1 Tax=Veillonella montpellierensis TaxID=187328 RepID=UPI0023FA1D4A|nr:MotA/TolQ/ExbB proton channel family protein [Veillonella montpellierensis]